MPKTKRERADEARLNGEEFEAIEVEAEVVKETDKPTLSLKEKCDNNKCLSIAVKQLQANEEVINNARLQSKLLDLLEMSKISEEEYMEAKALLE